MNTTNQKALEVAKGLRVSCYIKDTSIEKKLLLQLLKGDCKVCDEYITILLETLAALSNDGPFKERLSHLPNAIQNLSALFSFFLELKDDKSLERYLDILQLESGKKISAHQIEVVRLKYSPKELDFDFRLVEDLPF